MQSSWRKVLDAEANLKNIILTTPHIGIILGSGLGALTEEIEEQVVINYRDIPHFPQATVAGHEGQLVFGKLHDKNVLAMKGRLHYYEGHTMADITFPVRVMQKLGISDLIVTNAAGGINKEFTPGDLMLITDHINLMGDNPLRGQNIDQFGERFPDMSNAYHDKLRSYALKAAESKGIKLCQGVYAAVSGPSYETPAEIRYLRTIGADAVGMSTVPEVIVGNHAGMRVVGISCITNMAAGILPRKLDHTEVIEVANKVKDSFVGLVTQLVKEIEVS